MAEVEYLELSELQERIAGTVSGAFPGKLWVRAETGELKVNVSGHCYLTLVEKNPEGGGVKASVRAVIWASSFRTLKPFFESVTGRPLSAGMVILARVQVQYSGLYGLSLIISDIDPSFTVGELELMRQRTVARLGAEGMFDMNSSLDLARLPRRFAVITSPTAAGYRDFVKHLEGNEWGYRFTIVLFQAVMQGEECPSSIIAALDRVAASDGFDAVLIMRGGGGAADLSCFDDYDLAANVAQFPLPVLTGIGHDHDCHIVDMVAHSSLKTPTALADFILDIFVREDAGIDLLVRRLHMSLDSKFSKEEMHLQSFVLRMRSAVSDRYLREDSKLDLYAQRVRSADPSDVLSKGYSIVLKEGRRVASSGEVAAGDCLELMMSDGIVKVEVL